MVPPRVFVSYSHDSAKHKEWVLNFATTLRQRGIDAVLDQWDLKPGDDLPHFMETELEAADFILMICTNTYVEKANTGKGGVGYEKMIITSNLLSKIDESKIIPIIRQEGTADRPIFLKTKLYIDFSNDSETEYKLDEIIRTLLNSPLYIKPEIGRNPFKELKESTPDLTSDGIKNLMTIIAEAFNRTTSDRVSMKQLMSLSNMHRLSLDNYLSIAKQKGLVNIQENMIDVSVFLTDKGRKYIFDKEIIIP
ncbi:MAG: toll/interleukin-1 receptor domain-containing protein [Balneola sp.]